MKNGTLKRFTHRAMSMLLAVLTVLPSGLLTMPARAAEIQTTQTKLVVWDWIDDIQSLGKDGVDYDPNTDPFVDGHAAIPVGDTKYTRIMFYQSTGGDRYYFNGAPDGGTKSGDIYTTYHEDKIYVDADSRIGNSSHKEWNQDLADGDHFITVGGQRTPYIQYAEKKEGYHSWRFWCANEDDSLSDYTLMLVDDYEDLDLRRTYGGFSDPHIYYGGSNSRYRSDGWIIDKHFVGAAAANYQFSFDNFVIWHWDNDSGGYNETLDFDLGDRKFKSYNAGRDTGVEEFKIYLGKEYSVSTLAENYTVPNDQSQTLGRPLYYIPKGKVLTVAKDAVLSIDGVLLNDGEIVIEDGGLLVVKDGAKIMPLTKYDNNCGMITSKGNIVIGDDALLCGGGVNGIRILGGGVVNFGVMAAESFFVSENYAIDNRETGWVFAGKSPSRESRIRYITDAIANEGATKPTDVKKDFAKIGNFDSTFNIPVNGVYGNTANVSKTGEKAVGSASDPTLSVYTRATPNDAYETVFEDVKLDRVDVRVESDKVTYTAEGKTYTIQNKLVAAAIGRGDRDREAIFTDMWAGALDGAYVQLEPVRAPGMRLALSGGGVDGAKAVVWTANNDMDKWWHIAKAGTVGVNQTYYLDNVKSKGEARGLDISGVNSVSSGAAVQLYNHGDNGNDQRWILVQSSGTQYFFRNAANQNVSLAVTDAAPKNGTAVRVQTNSSYESGQYWNIVNLLTEDSYADAVTLGTAMEFIPQSATGMRMALPSGASAGQGVTIRTNDAANNAQRWRLEPAGTDDLDGVATTFYRVAEMNSGLALSVQGTEIKAGVAVVAANVAAGSSGNTQYWYLVEAGGADKYYVAARGNTGFVLSAPNSQNPASGAALSLAANVNASYQQWEIAGAGEAIAAEETAENSIDGKVFELEPSTRTGQRISIDNSGIKNMILRVATDKAGADDARWTFQRLGTDTVSGVPKPYYQIISKSRPNLALGFEGQTAQHGARLLQRAADADNRNEHWYVTENEDGTYTMSPREDSGLVLGFYKGEFGTYFALIGQEGGDYTKTTWNLHEIAEAYDPLDGKTFVLEPKCAPGMAAGVKDNSNDNDANVELQTAATSLYQQWTFEKAGVGELNGTQMAYYTIKSAGSYKVFDLPGTGGGRSGQSVTQYNSDGYADQHWFAVEGEDGYYTFVNRSNTDICLEVQGAGTTAGTNIQVYTGNNSDAQQWKLKTAPEIDRFDGKVFYISPKHAESKVLDLSGNNSVNGTNVQLFTKLQTEIERWKFEKAGVDYLSGKKMTYYKIINIYAGKLLDCNDKYENVQVKIYEQYKDDNSQLWYVVDAGDGYYSIIPKGNTTKYLDVNNNGTGDNTAVMLADQANKDSQKWKLTETIAPETFGTFQLGSVAKPGFDIDLSDRNNTSSSLVFYETNDDGGSHWKFEKMGTDSHGTYYRIYNNRHTSQVLEIAGSGTVAKDGATAMISKWENGTGTDQLWYLTKAGSDELGDYYYIENYQNSNYRLAVKDDKLERSAAIVLRNTTNDSAKWRLNEEFEPVDLGTYEFGNPTVVNMRLNVNGASKDNNANINLYHRHTTNAGGRLEQFKIVQRGSDMIDGVKTPYYSIENVNSGKVLDVGGDAEVSAEKNVRQWSYNGYADQHWYMTVLEDNTVVFRNRADSKLVLEAAGTSDNSNVRLNTYSDSNLNQRWQLHPVMETTESTAEKVASSITGITFEGTQYYIPGNQAAVDAGIPFASAEDTMLNPEVGGKYNLTPQHATTLRMDLNNGDTSNNRRIDAYTNMGSANQKWQFIPMGVDYYDGDGRIYYKLAYGGNANKVAQIDGYSIVTANKDIKLYDYDGCYDDLWYLEQAGERTEDGETFYNYYIIGRGTMSSANKICIAVPGGAGSGTQLQTATVRSGNSYKYMRWELTSTD